jgi:hypothetical protein
MGSGLAILTVSVFWIKALSDLSALALWWEEIQEREGSRYRNYGGTGYRDITETERALMMAGYRDS